MLLTVLVGLGPQAGLPLCAQVLPPLIDYAQPPPSPPASPPDEPEILHTWERTVFLGFDARNQLLIWNHSRRRIERHDGLSGSSPSPFGPRPEDDAPIVAGAMNHDRSVLATVSSTGSGRSRIRLWKVATGEPQGPEFPESDVTHVAFGPEGLRLAGVVDRTGALRVWDTRTATLRWSASQPRPMPAPWRVHGFSPDGRYLAAVPGYGLQLWDLSTRQVLGDPRRRTFLAVTPDWTRGAGIEFLGESSLSMRTRVWNLEDLADPVSSKDQPPEDLFRSALALAFAHDGRRMAAATREQRLLLWRSDEPVVLEPTRPIEGFVNRTLFSPDDKTLATLEFDRGPITGGMRGRVRLWQTEPFRPLGPSRVHVGVFGDWQFSPDSTRLVVCFLGGDNDPRVQVWRVPK